MKAALYLRVPTKKQTAENQERQLRQWAERLGFEILKLYADAVSGGRSDRAALAAALGGSSACSPGGDPTRGPER